MTLALVLLILAQDPSDLAQKAQSEIRDNEGKGLFKLLEDDYVPSLEWEAGLIPVLLDGLRRGSHGVRFSIDRAFPQVTGIRLIDLGGSPFESSVPETQKKVLDWLDRWWAKYKDRSRVDWLIDALGNSNLSMRRSAISYLSSIFDKSFGYEPDAPAEDRRAAIEEWKAFWDKSRNRIKWDRDKEVYAADAPSTDEELAKAMEWIEQLGDEEFQKREAATRRLIECGPEARKRVEEATRSKDPEVQWRARLILQSVPRLSKIKALQAEASSLARENNIKERVRALAAKDDAESALLLVLLCRGEDPELGRIAATRAARDPLLAWAMARVIRSTAWRMTNYSGHYLVTRGQIALFEQGLDKVSPYLDDPNPTVRMAAAGIVCSFATKAPEAVKKALGQTDARVRRAAIHGLDVSNDRGAARILLDHVKTEKEWDNRRWAVLAVGNLKNPAWMKELGEIASDPKEHLIVAGAAAQAIGEIGHLDGVQVLREVFAARKKDRYVMESVSRSALRMALAHEDDADAWKLVESLFLSEDPQIRLQTLWWVSNLCLRAHPRLRPCVEKASRDEDPKLRQAAETILRRWGE